ncbi:unnamed protein product [Dracunculus medinensis]|uniref:DUF295 domain-containing protein n=1 Tax=Dracunculus medinensis TaxID=318479 RepID=A0A0N4U6G0_DRAME|nr:unnamed protein product [Dracunculus medinensis]
MGSISEGLEKTLCEHMSLDFKPAAKSRDWRDVDMNHILTYTWDCAGPVLVERMTTVWLGMASVLEKSLIFPVLAVYLASHIVNPYDLKFCFETQAKECRGILRFCYCDEFGYAVRAIPSKGILMYNQSYSHAPLVWSFDKIEEVPFEPFSDVI